MSSTPLLAQAMPAPFTPEPVQAAPEPSPQPSAPSGTLVAPFNPEPVAAQRSSMQARSAPAEGRAAPARPNSSASNQRSTPAPLAAAPARAPTVDAPATAAPVVTSAVPPTAIDPIAAPVPAPAETIAPVTTESTAVEGNDVLPIVGATGAGLLLLGGGAALMLSRRRRREDAEPDRYDAEHDVLPADPFVDPVAAPVVAGPAMARTERERDPIFARASEPDMEGDPTLPPTFDETRYGRHAQAAFRGPTPDNPSQSLKKRLRRAAFFDMREREALAEEQGGEAHQEPIPAQAEAFAPATVERTDTVRTAPPVAAPRRPAIPRPDQAPMFGYRPAFQS